MLPKDSAAKGFGHGARGHRAAEGDRVTILTGDRSERTLSYDEDKPDIVHVGSVSFYVIKRADRFALRDKGLQQSRS